MKVPPGSNRLPGGTLQTPGSAVPAGRGEEIDTAGHAGPCCTAPAPGSRGRPHL